VVSDCSGGGVKAEVWNIDVAAKSSEYRDVQLSAKDTRPGRRLIDEHVKVIDTCHLLHLCYVGEYNTRYIIYIIHPHLI